MFKYVAESDWLRGRRKGVVCTDSKTALYLIRNSIDPRYKYLAFEAQRLLQVIGLDRIDFSELKHIVI